MNVFKVLESNVADSEMKGKNNPFFHIHSCNAGPVVRRTSGHFSSNRRWNTSEQHPCGNEKTFVYGWRLNRVLYLGGGSQQNPQKQMDNENTMMKIILNPK